MEQILSREISELATFRIGMNRLLAGRSQNWPQSFTLGMEQILSREISELATFINRHAQTAGRKISGLATIIHTRHGTDS